MDVGSALLLFGMDLDLLQGQPIHAHVGRRRVRRRPEREARLASLADCTLLISEAEADWLAFCDRYVR